MVHGDVKLDNIAFGFDEIVIIDWGAIVLGAGVWDVAHFVAGNLTTDVRRRHDADLLRLYHARLADLGVENYSFTRCLQDYNLQLLACWLRRVNASGRFDYTGAANERVRVWSQRLVAAMLDAGVIEGVAD